MKIKDLFNDALPVIAQFAPTIASVLGGPLGAAAGYIIPVLANQFNAHPTDIKDLVTKIIADPAAQSKLQAIEAEHGDWICTLQNTVSDLVKANIIINLEWANPK